MDKHSDTKNAYVPGLILFFTLSYVLSWLYMVPNMLFSHGLISLPAPGFMSYIAAYGPALSAIATLLIFNRKTLGGLFKRIVTWRVPIQWYITALLLQPAFILAAAGISYVMGCAPDFGGAMIFTLGNGITPDNALAAFIPYLLLQAISVLGEEIGWRGYALPALLSKSGWMTSGLILGGLWAVWHVPLFLTAGSAQSGMSPVWYFTDLMASSLIFVWLFMRSKGSVLIATLLHASINTFTLFLPVVPMRNGNLTPFIIFVLLKWGFVAVVTILHRRSKKDPVPTPATAAQE